MRTAPLRAAGRIAWRSARRNVRRSVLILVMVGLPVALVTATATVAGTIVGSAEEEVAATMGSADLLLTVGRRFDPDRLKDRLPSGSEVVAMPWEEVELVQQGELLNSTLVEPDKGLNNPVLKGLYELRSGRAPIGASEAAVNEQLLDSFEAQVGDEIELGEHRLTVTGIARARDHHPIAIVGPGTLGGHARFSYLLVDLPEGASAQPLTSSLEHARWHSGLTSRVELAAFAAKNSTTWDAASLIGGVLALFATGLIAAAAFVVGARRQLRELGLVAAIGGEPRHVRAVVWLGGTTLGFVGGVLGSVLGMGLAYAVHPLLDGLVGRVVGPVGINVFVLIAAVVMGTTAATLAAYAPARAAGKLSAMAALAGRTPLPRPPGRIAGLGILIVILGGALTAWSTITDRNALPAAGLIAMLLGVLCAIPLLVSSAGRVATRLPLAGRLAARDAARHGRRTGAAVAAAVIALAVPVAVSAYSLSEETYERRSPRLDDDQLLIGTSSEVATPSTPEEVAADFKKHFPDATLVPLTRAVTTHKTGDRDGTAYAGIKDDVGLVSWGLFVGDTAMLRAVHAEDGRQALTEGRAVVLGGTQTNNGFIRMEVPGTRGERTRKIPATAIESPSYLNESIPKIVISPATATRLGLDTEVFEQLLTTPRTVTTEDMARARQIAASHPGYFVNSNDDYLPPYAAGRAAATAASVPLALAVLAIAVALVASESRRSYQILVAVGAGSLAHRKVVAATSALLALITAMLAVPAGFLPPVVVQVASQAGRPIVIPWMTIGIVVIVTPLLSAAVAGLVARTPKLGSLLTPAT